MYIVIILDETHIFDALDKPCGKLRFSIKYFSDQLYLGEKIGIFESYPEQ